MDATHKGSSATRSSIPNPASEGLAFAVKVPKLPVQHLRLSPDPDGSMPTRRELFDRLLDHFKLEEELLTSGDDERSAAGDASDSWLLRNVTQNRYVARDDGDLDVVEGDVLEFQQRSVAGGW
jgi:hypothetical protein